MTRRALLLLLCSSLALLPPAGSAWAKDGDSGGGSGSGSSGGGSSGSGSSGSGSSGSGSSGSGSGNDDGGDDDDDDSGSDNSGSGKQSEQDRVLSAVSSGRAIKLEDAIARLRKKEKTGRVIDVSLRREGNRLVYRFKVKSETGRVRKITMDAATGEIRGFFGF